MPRIGMEPIRRTALVDATIAEVGQRGALDVTVGQIARRAGVSSALAHHYFGGKEDLLLAAMRHILAEFGREARAALKSARTPDARLRAVIQASFAPPNFRADVIAAWLSFYVHAQKSESAARLLRIYHRRLRSTLIHALRPACGEKAPELAETLAALIDGIYIRTALGEAEPDPAAAIARLEAVFEALRGRLG